MSFLADVDNITDGKEIRLTLTTHLLDDAEWSVVILNDTNYKLSLAEVQELAENLAKVVAELKAKEREKFQQAIERVNAL